MNEALCFLPATELVSRLRSGEVACSEVAESFLRRIEALNGVSHAYITVLGESALRRARALDALALSVRRTMPLCGLPLAVKDLIDVAGAPTTAGSRVLHDNVATRDAAAVERLVEAGAITLGKANLHEFAYGTTGANVTYGTCVNAYVGGKLACGSSSGSAAAVASGLATAALGTDTGGSVRIPAVLNGLVGLKPTYGLIPTDGTIPFSWSLDHVGLIARTIDDCALLLGEFAPACAGHQPAPSLHGIRVGLPATIASDPLDASIRTMFEQVCAFLHSAGATLEPIDLPDLDLSRTASLTIQMPEALSFHSRYLEARKELYGADLRAGLALGQFILAEHYLRAKRFAVGLRRDLDAILSRVDIVLTPATPIPAPDIGATHVAVGDTAQPVGNALTRYTGLFNMTGHPALTLPCRLHPQGTPIGVQLVGRHFGEDQVFAVARAIAGEPAFRIPQPPRA